MQLCDQPLVQRSANSESAVIETHVIAGTLGLAIHVSAEPIMRRGEARRVTLSRFEHGSTAVVSVLGLLPIILAIVFRATSLSLPGPLALAVGWSLVAVVMIGALLRFWSMAALGEFFTRTLRVHADHRLVQSGPYQLVRHPGYLANLLSHPASATILSDSGL